jgi:hypothetical protein
MVDLREIKPKLLTIYLRFKFELNLYRNLSEIGQHGRNRARHGARDQAARYLNCFTEPDSSGSDRMVLPEVVPVRLRRSVSMSGHRAACAVYRAEPRDLQ